MKRLLIISIVSLIPFSMYSNKSFLYKSPKECLMKALIYYNVKHPEIVYAQAVLETGNFTSEKCKMYNNLFGLYDSKRKRYYRFKHWTHSVKAYVDMIQYKYKGDNSKPPNDYYRFLQKIGYAKDTQYIQKLKAVVLWNQKNGEKSRAMKGSIK